MVIRKSLVYFEDIADDPIILNDKKMNFAKVKKFLTTTAKI